MCSRDISMVKAMQSQCSPAVRNLRRGRSCRGMDVNLGAWTNAIDGADIVINLAGRNVNCRYTPANRREIMDSRILSTRVVGQAIAQAAKPPALWMNASTATIYRHALDRAMDESTGELGGHEPDAPSTWSFSIDVATSWEREFFAADTPHTRKIALRSAMTMSPDPETEFLILFFVLSGQAWVEKLHQESSLFPGFTKLISCAPLIC